MLAANVLVLLQAGYFITVSPVLRLWLCFADEVKNFCLALFVELEQLLLAALC